LRLELFVKLSVTVRMKYQVRSLFNRNIQNFDTSYFPRIISSYLQGNKLGKRWDLLDNEMLYQQHASHTIWYQQL